MYGINSGVLFVDEAVVGVLLQGMHRCAVQKSWQLMIEQFDCSTARFDWRAATPSVRLPFRPLGAEFVGCYAVCDINRSSEQQHTHEIDCCESSSIHFNFSFAVCHCSTKQQFSAVCVTRVRGLPGVVLCVSCFISALLQLQLKHACAALLMFCVCS
jgi:hypothetical protein